MAALHRRARAAAAAAVLCTAWLGGNYHIVWGTNDPLHLTRKVSWSLREIFINTDEIAGTPTDLLRAQRWPLYFHKLAQERSQLGAQALSDYQAAEAAKRAASAPPPASKP